MTHTNTEEHCFSVSFPRSFPCLAHTFHHSSGSCAVPGLGKPQQNQFGIDQQPYPHSVDWGHSMQWDSHKLTHFNSKYKTKFDGKRLNTHGPEKSDAGMALQC